MKRFSQPFRRKSNQIKKPRSSVPEGGFNDSLYQVNIDNSESGDDDDVLDNPPDIVLDDTLTEDVEITPGGWICRVERFEKLVDSSGRTHYQRQRKKSPSPLVDQDLAEAKKPEKKKKYKLERNVKQSIIDYIHHISKTDSKDLIDPDIYIEIKSPLILKVLRENTSYGHQV